MKTTTPQAPSGIASPSPLADRILVLDPLRAVAALAVMWFHFTSGGSLLEDASGPSAWLKASGAKGWLGVEVFFVISGFILPYAMWRGRYRLRDYGAFLVKRLLRLEPPYLCAVALAVGLWMAGSLAPGFAGEPFAFEWTRLLLHVGYLNAFFDLAWYNPVFWTLAIEFQFYLLIALLFPLVVHRLGAVRMAVPVGLAALGLLVTDSGLVFHHLALFALGIAAAQWYIGLLPLRSFGAVFSVLAAVSYASLGTYPTAVGVVTALLVALLAGVRREQAWGRLLGARPLVWLGTISYSLYLIHVPIGGRVINLGARLADGLAEQLIVLGAAVLASLLASYALHRFVERPSQRWSSSVRYRRAEELTLHVPNEARRAA